MKKSEKRDKIRYTEYFSTRIPKVVGDAINKVVEYEQTKIPSYNSAEFLRLAAVHYLKHKGILSHDKRYL